MTVPTFSAPRRFGARRAIAAGAALAGSLGWSSSLAQSQSELLLRILDQSAQGVRVSANVFLTDAQGKAVLPPSEPFWRTHFSSSGEARLSLPPGSYRFAVDRGPEVAVAEGSVTLAPGQTATVETRLRRIANLRSLGWRSGDTHVHRPPKDLERLAAAGDMDVLHAITWWNRTNAWAGGLPPTPLIETADGRRIALMGGEDEREGGALLFFGLPSPLPIQRAERDYPPAGDYLTAARKQPGVWIDIEKPFWWDAPVWLSQGVDTVGLAHNHMHRDGVLGNEAWGRARDAVRYPGARGNGHYTQGLYYRILEAGLRVPPSAGSASGVLPNPVGYNRVYAHVPEPWSYEGWSRAVREGRSFVTNGPLLLTTVSGQDPGAVFRLGSDGGSLKPEVRLWSREAVGEIEVVHNGRVVSRTRVSPDGKRVSLPRISITEPGWLLVRVINPVDTTFRFASSAPFYVEVAGRPPRVNRAACRTFVEWIRERAGRLKTTDAAQIAHVRGRLDAAEAFWKRREAAGTVEEATP